MLRRACLIALSALLLLTAVAVADEITGTPGDDVLAGTAADDTINGLGGNDRLDGGAGNDTLSGGAGTDDVVGGSGRDAASYADATAGVEVSIDDLANDGTSGESDNIQTDVEDLFGGEFGDVLAGSAGPNTIDAHGGNDTIDAGAGADFLFGGAGDDRLNARDGVADTLDCGDGSDIAIVDPKDVLTGCEIVDNREAVASTAGTVRNNWTAFIPHTTINVLRVRNASPANARIEVRCKGRGCPFSLRRKRARGGEANLKPDFGKAKLRVGTVVEVRILAAGVRGTVERFLMRRLKVPRVTHLCLPPGEKKPRKCESS